MKREGAFGAPGSSCSLWWGRLFVVCNRLQSMRAFNSFCQSARRRQVSRVRSLSHSHLSPSLGASSRPSPGSLNCTTSVARIKRKRWKDEDEEGGRRKRNNKHTHTHLHVPLRVCLSHFEVPFFHSCVHVRSPPTCRQRPSFVSQVIRSISSTLTLQNVSLSFHSNVRWSIKCLQSRVFHCSGAVTRRQRMPHDIEMFLNQGGHFYASSNNFPARASEKASEREGGRRAARARVVDGDGLRAMWRNNSGCAQEWTLSLY